MSDRDPAEELVTEFGRAMRAAMQAHAQASNWMQRRQARKQISRLVRLERHEQAQARVQQLSRTNMEVDRYRQHALRVAERANDPMIDHERRYRDAVALRDHRDQIAGRVVGNGRLTPVERGIALDGLDAASIFPEYATGDLFGRAHRVKGLEALHYRARVAREQGAVQQRQAVAASQFQQSMAEVRTRNLQENWLDQRERDAVEPGRFRASVTWKSPDGTESREDRSFGTDYVATSWQRREIDHALTFGDTTVAVETWDAHNDHAPLYRHEGRPGAVAKSAGARAESLRRIALERGTEQTPKREPAVQQGSERAQPVSDPARNLREVAQLRTERDSLAQRLNLSIEHNGDLTDQNGRLTRDLAAADERAEKLVTELHRMRAERDEAVRAVAARTPAAQRFGSAERQAEQARQAARQERPTRTASAEPSARTEESVRSSATARMAAFETTRDEQDARREATEQAARDEVTRREMANAAPVDEQPVPVPQQGRSALADYQPGRTLAEAVARNGAERNGAEHDR